MRSSKKLIAYTYGPKKPIVTQTGGMRIRPTALRESPVARMRGAGTISKRHAMARIRCGVEGRRMPLMICGAYRES